MKEEDVVIRAGSGAEFPARLFTPDAPAGSAVMIVHGANRLGEHEFAAARRLAGEGHVVLAASYYPVGHPPSGPEFNARVERLLADARLMRDPLEAALGFLRGRDGVEPARIAVLGYCLGGHAALELARTGADLAAVVAFHATLPTEGADEARAIRGKLLVLNGSQDPLVPPAMQQAFAELMNAAGVDWQMTLYGGTVHGYTMTEASREGYTWIAYQPDSDRRSWAAMLALLDETIAG